MNSKIILVFVLTVQIVCSVNLKCRLRDVELIFKTNTHPDYREKKIKYFTCEVFSPFLVDLNETVSIEVSGSERISDSVQCVFIRNGTLKFIPNQFFKTFRNLDFLAIDQPVGLKTLNRNFFIGGKNLKKFAIWFNRFERIESSVFKELESLEYLNLAGNNVSEIAELAFEGLTNLKGLYLYENQLKFLREKIFYPLINLEELFLDRNFLQFLPSKLFGENKKLSLLILSKNKLVSLSPQLLDNLKLLMSLDLRNNSCVNEKIDVNPRDLRIIYSKLKICFANDIVGASSELRELEAQMNLIRNKTDEFVKKILEVQKFMNSPENYVENTVGSDDPDNGIAVRSQTLEENIFLEPLNLIDSKSSFPSTTPKIVQESSRNIQKIRTMPIDNDPFDAMYIVVTIIVIASFSALAIYVVVFCSLK